MERNLPVKGSCFLVFLLLSVFSTFAQGSLSLGTIGVQSTEHFTPGSSIAVPFTISGNACIGQNNVFGLYLSDATGNFANEVQIGEFQGFYTAFLNGIIPNNTTVGLNTEYRLRVKASNPAITSDPSDAFVINSGASLIANITGVPLGSNADFFGTCNAPQPSYNFTNETSGVESVVASFQNLLTGQASGSLTFQSSGSIQEFNSGEAHYLVFAKAIGSGGRVSTHAYMLINNLIQNSITTSGQLSACIRDNESGNLTVSLSSSIDQNYPGILYQVNWGDGSGTSSYTICELNAQEKTLSHAYTETSCGRAITGAPRNTYPITISLQSSFCESIGNPVSTSAFVADAPINRITAPTTACLETPVTFVNESDLGQLYNSNSQSCQDDNPVYDWYVDGVIVAANVPRNTNFTHTFNQPGEHTVRLVSNSSNNTICSGEDVTHTICIEPRPVPQFTIPETVFCETAAIDVNNTTITEGFCSELSWQWTLIDLATNEPVAANVLTFRNGTSATSQQPQLTINVPGRYILRLTAGNSCADVPPFESEEILVSGNIHAAFPAEVHTVQLCEANSPYLIDFDTDALRPVFSGFTNQESIQWTLPEGVSFAPGSSASDRYPEVLVSQNGDYVVQVVYVGDCDQEATASITLQVDIAPLTVSGSLTPDVNTVCSGNAVNIQLSGQTGTVLYWEASTDGTSWIAIPNTAGVVNYTSNPLTIATQFRAVVQSGGCDLARTALVSIAIAPAIPAPDAGPDQVLCNQTETQLNAVQPEEGTGVWEFVEGPAGAVIQNPSALNTAVTNLQPGTYRLRWRVSNNVCEATDEVIIYNWPPISNNEIQDAGDDGIYCFGASITVTGSDPQGGDPDSYTYQWQYESNGNWNVIANANAKDLVISTLPMGNQTVRRLVLSGNCEGISNEVAFTVQPEITNNQISTDQEICEGTVASELTGSTPSGGIGQYNYQWQSSTDNSNFEDIPNATGIHYAPGTPTETRWYRRLISSPTCPDIISSISNVVQITVQLNAIAEFTVQNSSACIPFDIGSEITVVPHPEANSTYEWYANGDLIGEGVDFPGYVLEEDNSTVEIRLIARSRFGCEDDVLNHVFSTLENPRPSFTKSTEQGCGPLAVQFTNESNLQDDATFVWDFGNGQTYEGVQPPDAIIFEADPAHEDRIYTITLTATTPCAEFVYTDELTVRPTPVARFNPNTTTPCSESEVTFTNTSLGGPATYTFDFGDGSAPLVMESLEEVTHIYSVEETTDFTVTLTVENECGESSFTAVLRVFPVNITGDFFIDGDQLSGCAPFEVTFRNAFQGAYEFRWDYGDGSEEEVSYTSPENRPHTFNEPGTYEVTVRALSSCGEIVSTKTVRVDPMPSSDFTIPEGPNYVDEEIQFLHEDSESDYVQQYSWSFGDGNTSTEQNPQHTYTEPGTYLVELTVDNGPCSSTTQQYILIEQTPGRLFVPNAFQPSSLNEELRLFKPKGQGLVHYRIRIYARQGQLIWESADLFDGAPAEGWDGTIAGRDAPQGVYVWEIEASFLDGSIWQGMKYKVTDRPKRVGMINLIR